ncbi:hypothetical protein DL89DRAFT_263230, partial [Linderina pennispora]
RHLHVQREGVHAQAAGATGVVIYNNVAGAISPSVTDTTVTIPVVGISLSDGQYIVSALTAGGVSVRAQKGDIVTVPSETGGQMSSFNGPSAELDIAPRISAPGGNIYSTALTWIKVRNVDGHAVHVWNRRAAEAGVPKYSVAEIHRV